MSSRNKRGGQENNQVVRDGGSVTNLETSRESEIKSYKTLPELFEGLSVHWQEIVGEAKKLGEHTLSALPAEIANKKLPEFVEKQSALEEAVAALEARLRQPELTLAMTGTTSSGKSTLVNLLVGDDIMPAAVQEMSAGVVQITHSTTDERSLRIEKTRGASWATGVWENLTPKALRDRLDETMQKFREAEKSAEGTGGTLDPVVFHVSWPTYMGSHPERFGLPANVKLTLLDLPGLKAIDDSRNGPVIQNNIRKALSLVVYNSAETDKDKQKKLLADVVEQVQKLRASPDRMLFVLNKIDVFLADGEKRDERRKHFEQEITEQLRDVIKEALPEHGQAAERIVPVPLSSRPALLGREILADDCSKEEKIKYVEELDEQFQGVVPGGFWKKIPRDVGDADEADIQALARSYIEASGLPNFEQTVASHIGKNLPSLLLQDVISGAQTALGDMLTHTGAILDEAKVTNEAVFKDRQEKLESFFLKVRGEQEKIVSKIKSLADVMGSSVQNADHELEPLVTRLSSECGEKKLLSPLSFPDRFVITAPYAFVANDFPAEILDNRYYERSNGRDQFVTVYEEGYFPQVGDRETCRHYYNSLVKLRKSPSGAFWKKGGSLEEGKTLDDAKEALEEFADWLGSVCQRLFPGCAREHGKRIEDVLQRYIGHLIGQLEDDLERNYEEELQHFPSVGAALAGMDGLDNMPEFVAPEFNFSPEYQKLDEQSHVELREKITTLTWLTLGLYREKEEEKVIDQRAGIEFPPLDKMTRSFLNASGARGILHESISRYVTEVIKLFRKVLHERFERVRVSYKQAQEERLAQLQTGLKNDEEQLMVACDDIASLEILGDTELRIG